MMDIGLSAHGSDASRGRWQMPICAWTDVSSSPATYHATPITRLGRIYRTPGCTRWLTKMSDFFLPQPVCSFEPRAHVPCENMDRALRTKAELEVAAYLCIDPCDHNGLYAVNGGEPDADISRTLCRRGRSGAWT